MGRAGKDKMKKGKSEAGERIRRVREEVKGRTQGEFAEALAVTQSMVSAWETGRDEPSSEAYLNLVGKASRPEDRLWFLERAGVDTGQALRDAVENLPSVPSAVQALLTDLPSKVELRRVTEEEARGGVFTEGDIFLLEPTDDPQKPARFWDEVVLLEFAPKGERQEGWVFEQWPEGLFLGRLLCKRSRFDRLSYEALVGGFQDSSQRWSPGGVVPQPIIGRYRHEGPKATPEEEAEIQRLTEESDKVHEAYQKLQNLYSAIPYSEFRKLPEAQKLGERSSELSLLLTLAKGAPEKRAEEEAEREAPEKIETLLPGVRILGRVVAWFAAPKERR